ncbi:MAG: hypothetical protein AB7F41_01740 [Methylocystis sp.]|uniref:hypothetical protein n=1 Tax=Methylocystis sp. TaxID=1911079 RepID=UPI003D0E1CFB
MPLGHLWAGRVFGTNTGNLFLKLDGPDSDLVGTLHINDPHAGVAVFRVQGAFDGSRVSFSGEPQTVAEGMTLGQLKASGVLDPKGNLTGNWETTIGTAGTFMLFPHDHNEISSAVENSPDQLHTARHDLGAILIDRDELTALAQDIQSEFSAGKVVITVTVGGVQQSRFLADFNEISFSSDKATFAKIFVQEPMSIGGNKLVSIEFSQDTNYAMTQAPDEAWALGKLEKLKAQLRKFERFYTTNFWKLGFGINQILLVGTIICLPSLPDTQSRAILMFGVLLLIWMINRLHSLYLPFAAIYLGKRPEGVVSRLMPSLASWIISATAGIAATLLAAYLQGQWKLPWLNP